MDNKIILRDNLFDITKVLANHSVPCCILSGTLLGFIRDKDFIDNDLDVDVGVIVNGAIDLIAWYKIFRNLESLGFTFRRAGTSSVITIDRGFGSDIWWIFKKWDENHKPYYALRAWNGEFRYAAQHFDNFEEIEYQNRTFKIPSNSKGFLESTYGPDWKTPNPNFKHPMDSPCFRPTKKD
jgi:hypothetical protein